MQYIEQGHVRHRDVDRRVPGGRGRRDERRLGDGRDEPVQLLVLAR